MNLIILCEGQTEESFVKNIMIPYFNPTIKITPIIFATKTTPTKVYRGGITKYDQVVKEIKKLSSDKNNIVTTMMDFYGFPLEFEHCQTLDEKINYINNKLLVDVEASNFYPNLIVHEFEMLIFCNLIITCNFFNYSSSKTHKILSEYRSFSSPELINNSPLTAPSKRLLKLFPRYRKIIHGTELSKRIGIDKMRKYCHYFNKWLKFIETCKKI